MKFPKIGGKINIKIKKPLSGGGPITPKKIKSIIPSETKMTETIKESQPEKSFRRFRSLMNYLKG